MTKDGLLMHKLGRQKEMARQALEQPSDIDAAIKAENEACAKVCEELEPKFLGDDVLATECADAIRARVK